MPYYGVLSGKRGTKNEVDGVPLVVHTYMIMTKWEGEAKKKEEAEANAVVSWGQNLKE